MNYKETNLFFLQEDCIALFGKALGTKVFGSAAERLNAMLVDADFKNNKEIEYHICKNMYPAIAFYKSLQDCDFSKEEAYNFIFNETQKWAQIKKQRNQRLTKIPFTYQIFRLFIKGVMKKSFPVEGWETEWARCDNKEIHFNFKRCIYVDITKKYGCAELCSVFCKNDDIAFSGYEPKVFFHRNGTLADGSACCDFHFTYLK